MSLSLTTTLRCASFLSPALFPTYEQIVAYVGGGLDRHVSLTDGASWQDVRAGRIDLSFMCGLEYVRLSGEVDCPVEPLVAPVLYEARYGHRPIYYSDVVVHRDSPFSNFDDLAGCTWAYNERRSHSGYSIVRYSLLLRNQLPTYFRRWIKTGSHARSLAQVASGRVDAAAIDSHVLAVLLRTDSGLAARVRVIDMLGPSPIPPVVVRRTLDNTLKRRLRALLCAMHLDTHARERLGTGLIARFVPITDGDYADIRRMAASVASSRVEHPGAFRG